ncbi:MAG: PfkB family carbohydrate kinase [Steroidobacteraceae bacterium]|nr:PfkB family carbohydrate kinase [Steroidobacteraceae bacterium]
MTMHVVGGVYREQCVHPRVDDVYGSAGRAALALATVDCEVALHSYMNDATSTVMREKAAYVNGLTIHPTAVEQQVGFRYLHPLARPEIYNIPDTQHPPLRVRGDEVVRFGMLEGDAIVEAEWSVYDPQNAHGARGFHENGSSAIHLALVLNAHEAHQLVGGGASDIRDTAATVAKQQRAEVVVIKMGAKGALVWTSSGVGHVPAYRSTRVWKIGSGDCFVAHFAHAWIRQRRPPIEAAELASIATAFYCETQGFPTAMNLAGNARIPVQFAIRPADEPRQIYLAGPFFDLMQVMLVEQARSSLTAMGLKVFSPYHDIGLGSARDVAHKDLEAIGKSDVLFAISDGLDAGTVFEVGYARALKKPVVVYSERHREESVKMMEGSGCIMCNDFTTAVYSTLWEAVAT